MGSWKPYRKAEINVQVVQRHEIVPTIAANFTSEKVNTQEFVNAFSMHAYVETTATWTLYGSNLEVPDVETASDWVEIGTGTASELVYIEAPCAWVYADIAWTAGDVRCVLLGNSP